MSAIVKIAIVTPVIAASRFWAIFCLYTRIYIILSLHISHNALLILYLKNIHLICKSLFTRQSTCWQFLIVAFIKVHIRSWCARWYIILRLMLLLLFCFIEFWTFFSSWNINSNSNSDKILKHNFNNFLNNLIFIERILLLSFCFLSLSFYSLSETAYISHKIELWRCWCIRWRIAWDSSWNWYKYEWSSRTRRIFAGMKSWSIFFLFFIFFGCFFYCRLLSKYHPYISKHVQKLSKLESHIGFLICYVLTNSLIIFSKFSLGTVLHFNQ